MASTPCAACKLLRRKCTQECVFAPYFPPTQPQKFIFVHRVFGASNVTKILNDLPHSQREEAVNSLYYEAEARLRDPIYGCVGLISFLQQCHKKIQQDLLSAKEELAGYMGSDSIIPYLPPLTNPPPNFMMNMEGMITQGDSLIMSEPNLSHQLQLSQSQQLQDSDQLQLSVADAQRMASMILERGDQGMFNGGYGIENNGSGTVTSTGYNQMDVNGGIHGPSLALGSYGNGYNQMSQEIVETQGQGQDQISSDQLQTQLMLQPPLQEGQEQSDQGQFLMNSIGDCVAATVAAEEEEDEEEEFAQPPMKWRKSGEQGG